VVSARFLPEADFLTFARGGMSGAAKGFAGGAAVTGLCAALAGGTVVSGPLVGIPLIIFCAPLAAATPIAAAVGAAKAIPEKRAKEIDDMLKNAFAELKMQEAIRDRILETGTTQTGEKFVLAEEAGPSATDQEVDYLPLYDKGIDSVLEVSILSIHFHGEGRDPSLTLAMTARAKLIRSKDGSVLYETNLDYRSAARKFTDWLADNARPFSEELELGYRNLSEKIIEEIFLVYNLPLNPV